MDTSASKTTRLPLTSVLSQLASQLHQIEISSQQVEDAIADTLESLPGGTGAGRPSLQQIDYIVQALHDLQTFLTSVASVVPAHIIVEISEFLEKNRLRDMAKGLSRSSPDENKGMSVMASGDVQLF
jgi:hypothetical protein